MGDTVKKIIVVLITIVVCVVIGAIVINIVAPNAAQAVIGGVEAGIHAATGISIDLDNTNDRASDEEANYAGLEAGGSDTFQDDITAGGAPAAGGGV